MYEKQKLEFNGLVEKINKDYPQLRIDPQNHKALKGIIDFSHFIRLYWSHKRDIKEHQKTYIVTQKRYPSAPKLGVFACRSPYRLNPIHRSVGELHEVEECLLRVQKVDTYEGKSIIEIKLYIPHVDCIFRAKAPK